MKNIKNIESRNSLKGITLIETIVYLGLFALIFSIVTQFFFIATSNNEDTSRKNDFQRATIFIDEHIKQSVGRAINIDEIGSIFDSSTSRIRLNTSSGVIEYSIDNGQLMVNRAGVINEISSAGYQITNFLAERIELSDASLVGIRLTVEFYDERNNVDKTFTTSYLLK